MTLIEIIVVLVVISTLAALVTPAIYIARRKADKDLCRQEITRLALGIENFADQDKHADFPPAILERLGIKNANAFNEGNESMVLCLATARGEGPYFQFDADRLANRDADVGSKIVLQDQLAVMFKDDQLREYVDVWGSPYVYFPYQAYGKKAMYLKEDGEEFEACVLKDAGSGLWPAPSKFVIWSCGPDGVNENGGGDDIVSWR